MPEGIPCPKLNHDSLHRNRNHTARVVLPEPDDDSDKEEPHSEDEDGDFLADYPDDTDVSRSLHLHRARKLTCTIQELDLVHARIGSLSPLHLERFKDSLRKLCLRQNHISQLDPQSFHQLTLLTELDLYDNKLKNQGLGNALDHLTGLTYDGRFWHSRSPC